MRIIISTNAYKKSDYSLKQVIYNKSCITCILYIHITHSKYIFLYSLIIIHTVTTAGHPIIWILEIIENVSKFNTRIEQHFPLYFFNLFDLVYTNLKL